MNLSVCLSVCPCLNLNNDANTKCNILYFKIKMSIHIFIRRLLTVLYHYGNSNTNDMRITRQKNCNIVTNFQVNTLRCMEHRIDFLIADLD